MTGGRRWRSLRRVRALGVLLLLVSGLAGAADAAFAWSSVAEAPASALSWDQATPDGEESSGCPDQCSCSCACACTPAPVLPTQRVMASAPSRPRPSPAVSPQASLHSIVRSPRTRPPLS
jgi:hypothetical protein